MPIKRRLTTLEGLPADVAKLYVKDGDEFNLEIEGDDVGPLKRAKEHEKTKRLEAEQALKDARAELATMETELADARAGKKPADVAALEKTHAEKLAKIEKKAAGEVAKAKDQVKKLLVDATADRLAQELSTAPELMRPHLLARMTVEEVDGEPVLRFTKDGKPDPDLTEASFRKEIIDTKTFAPILAASKGSGGGAGGSSGKGGGASLAQFRNAAGELQFGKLVVAMKTDPALQAEFNAWNAEQNKAAGTV